MSCGRGLSRTALEIDDCNNLKLLMSLPMRYPIKQLAKLVDLICGIVTSASRSRARLDSLSLKVKLLEIALRNTDKVRDFRQ
ncbi:hypothetical protein D3C80_1920790 [compost metagenome]